MDFRWEPLFLSMAVIFCLTVLAEPVIGIGAQSGFSEEENYEYVEENWNGSKEINFDEYWKGENRWGGYHIVYPVQLNTRKLIQEGQMRSDCMDVRVASEGQLLGTRVQDNTCNTTETWVYFGNPDLKDGLVFDENESIEDIEIFYGNKNASLSKYTTSVYNDDIATVLKPESALGMYYGHHTSVYTNQETTLERNDKDAPEQEWSVDFETDHGDTGTDEIHISDQEGNSASFSSGDTYTITSSNAPSWVDQGDTLDVYFTSQEVCYNGCSTDTSNTESAQWGYPVQFSNPRPAKSNYGSPVDTTSPDLKIDVNEPNGNDVTVSFYNADNNNLLGSQTVSGSGTASTQWSGLTDGSSYRWYAEGCTGGCKQTDSDYEFDVNGIPQIENVDVSDAGTEHAFDIEARVTDSNGYNDLDSCDITAQDQSGNSYNYGNVDFESESGNEAFCRHRVRFDDDTDWDHLSTIDFDITVSDSKNTDTYSGTQTFPNHGPSISSTSFSFDDYTDEHAFNVSATVEDVDASSSSEIVTTCNWEFEDSDGVTVTDSSAINYNAGTTAECFYSNVNSSMPYPSGIDDGFEPNEQITTNLKVSDIHGKSDSETAIHNIPNRAPEVDALIQPVDGSLVTGTPTLEVDVSDSEDDPFNLTFIDTGTGNQIDFIQNAHTLSTVSTDWDASLGENSWKVGLNDSYDYVESSEYDFTRVISNRFRLRQEIQYDYSSLILTEDGTETTFLEVTNLHPNEKDIKVDLASDKGYFEAFFLRNSANTTTFSLQQGETETLQVRVNSDNVTESRKDKLIVTSTDQNVGAVNTQELDILVRSSEAEFRDAPGLTSIYLVFIGLVSVLLFGLSM